MATIRCSAALTFSSSETRAGTLHLLHLTPWEINAAEFSKHIFIKRNEHQIPKADPGQRTIGETFLRAVWFSAVNVQADSPPARVTSEGIMKIIGA